MRSKIGNSVSNAQLRGIFNYRTKSEGLEKYTDKGQQFYVRGEAGGCPALNDGTGTEKLV